MATESWIVSGPQVFDLEAVSSLTASLAAGRVSVVGRDEPGVRLEVQSVRGRPLEVTLTDGALAVGYENLGWDSWLRKAQGHSAGDAAEIIIAAERTIAARLGGVSAEGLLEGIEADCSISTASGGVIADSCRGRLRANTVSGRLSVRDHTGELLANAVSGNLTISGDLSRIDVTTVSGDIVADLLSTSSVVVVRGFSADTTLRLPKGVGVLVKLTAVSGRLAIDGETHPTVSLGGVTVDERTGGGGCWLEVQTVSGRVAVVHQDDGAARGHDPT